MAAVRGRDFLLVNRAYGSVFGGCAPNALLFRLRDQLVAEAVLNADESGDPELIYRDHGMDVDSIVAKAVALVARK